MTQPLPGLAIPEHRSYDGDLTGATGTNRRGRQPKLTDRRQAELVNMHATGDYTIAELMEVFSVGRATGYRREVELSMCTPLRISN